MPSAREGRAEALPRRDEAPDGGCPPTTQKQKVTVDAGKTKALRANRHFCRILLISETSASVSGGNQNTRFFISGLALNEEGIVNNTGYEKYSGKINVEHRFSDRLTINANTTFTAP